MRDDATFPSSVCDSGNSHWSWTPGPIMAGESNPVISPPEATCKFGWGNAVMSRRARAMSYRSRDAEAVLFFMTEAKFGCAGRQSALTVRVTGGELLIPFTTCEQVTA